MYPLLVSVAECCEILSIGRTKAYELIGTGVLATVKIGDRRLVRTESIRKLAETGDAQ